MTRTRPLRASAWAVAAILCFGPANAGFAQDPPKDDALDRLLEKLEGKTPDPAPPKVEAKKDEPKKDDAKKPEAKKPEAKKDDKPKDAPKPKPKPAAEEEPKDKALDSLLEKLGEAPDAPRTTGKGEDSPDMPKPKDKDAAADPLKEDQKPLDEHLGELAGRAPKKKKGDQEQQQQPGQGQGQPGDADDSSPLGQAVKKMRQVESKLGEAETGEETRKAQGEIVKDLDTLIAQAKKAAQGSGKPGRKVRGQGQQPGDQQGDQQGTDANARGAGPMKTAEAKNTPALVGDKNTWGNLPAMLRDEMENVFKAEMLPNKARQISRYYESINKKSLAPSRGN